MWADPLKQEPTSVFILEFLPDILQRFLVNVLAPHPRQILGGSHLQQSQLVLPALHPSTFAAQRGQPFAQLPVIAFLPALHAPVRQRALAFCKVCETLVLARSTALLHRDAVSVHQHLSYKLIILHIH